MHNFTYDALPGRVIFGAGRLAELPEALRGLGLGRALVLATPGQRALGERAAALLGELAVGLYAGAVMHVPTEAARAGAEEARAQGADCTVAIGGGSTVGLGKAIALELGLPVVAVPTTYSGSEMTPIWGLTDGGIKRTGRDARVLPRLVLYDPELTLGLPPSVSGPSGINALAHCVEALYAPDANPITSLIAEEGIRALAAGLPAVVREPAGLEARGEVLYGAYLAGAALAAVQMGLHHKLSHTLGGRYNLPHAELHTVILPHAAAYNRAAAPEAMRKAAHALGGDDAPGALFALAGAVGAKRALRELGMREEDLDEAAELASRNPYANPAPVTREGIRRLLDDAFHGRAPG
jgi:maleylacetate reductase